MAMQAEKEAEKEVKGWWQAFQQELKEGKFNTYARVGGVTNFVLIVFLSWTFFISLFPHSTLCLVVGILVGMIELPFCCNCIPQCNRVAARLAPAKIYWMRGCGYLFLAFLLALTGGGMLMLFFEIILVLDGVCYILAHFKGESEEPKEDGYDSLERGQDGGVDPVGNPSMQTTPPPLAAPEAPPDLASPEDFKAHRTQRGWFATHNQM